MRLLPLALALISCGDPLVDNTYRGEPIWFVEGTINAPEKLDDDLSLGDDVRASLFWIPNLSVLDQPVLVEQSSVTAEVRFPATFEVRVFEPPDVSHFVNFDDRYAAALLLIYVDKNLDGFYGAADQVVGGTLNKVLLFARETVPAEASPTGEPIPVGFSLGQPPLVCPQTASGREEPLPLPPERLGFCEIEMCPEDWNCNLWGFCEPEYPLTITVLESQFIPKDILCPAL
jgi:hypothetical protein